MKAISLWQPWASLWLTDRKVHETRPWSTQYRGPLMVHAAKRPVDLRGMAVLEQLVADEFGEGWRAKLPLGGLIGIVVLADCYPATINRAMHEDDRVTGNWMPGRFAWLRQPNVTKFDEVVPWIGRQRIFNVPLMEWADDA